MAVNVLRTEEFVTVHFARNTTPLSGSLIFLHCLDNKSKPKADFDTPEKENKCLKTSGTPSAVCSY